MKLSYRGYGLQGCIHTGKSLPPTCNYKQIRCNQICEMHSGKTQLLLTSITFIFISQEATISSQQLALYNSQINTAALEWKERLAFTGYRFRKAIMCNKMSLLVIEGPNTFSSSKKLACGVIFCIFLSFFDQSNLSPSVEMYFQWTHFDSESCLQGLPVLQPSAQFIYSTNCCLSPAAWQTFKTLKKDWWRTCSGERS